MLRTDRPVTADPGTLSPVDLFRAQARAHGDREALVDSGRGAQPPLTYAALLSRVDALACRLRQAGAGEEQPVAVLLGRPADTVVAMLAVLASGGAYCPLDIEAPGARNAAIMRRLGARVAVAGDPAPRWLRVGTVVVDPAAAPPPEAFAAARPGPDTLAYVMHTSGSTGVPKGVAATHRGLARLVRWQLASGPAGLRTLQFTATSFDVTFQEVLSTLAGGGCLVVVPDEVRRDPAALLDTIVRQRVQRLFLPYVALQLMAVAAGRLGVVPASLEHVITAGERLIITPAIRGMFAALPRCRLDNHYGPTETHLVTSLELPPDPAGWPEVPAIGAPVDGVSCQVLDQRLSPVPDGDAGELYVSVTGLARGYLHDPARTAERFVASPFAPGERLYRTGDLVRACGDGSYEFLGRADGQLKVRGFRVEPAEVEKALMSHPRVDAAAVGLREAADGVSVLAGYVQTNGPVSPRDLTAHLRGLLPAYMVPARYVTVAAMPRTATGKTDRRALSELPLPPTPGQEPATPGAQQGQGAAPLTEFISATWARVLGHDEFAGDDDFFDVGGDSLLATWVVTELRQALDRPVELSLLLEHSTVDGLAAALGSAATATLPRHQSSQVVTLRPGPSGRSVYFVHPLGGELLGYRELAHASTAPVRLLGISWTGEPPASGSTLAEIARTHVEQLRAIEPDGLYRLAGWSFGGVLAYEMAQQLVAAGGTVEFLGLFDANPVIDPITGLPMARTPFLQLLDTVVARLEDPATTGAELLELTSGRTWLQLMGAPITAGAASAYLRTVLQTAQACMNAAMQYQPQPYPGPVHLFHATGGGAKSRAGLAAMRRLCTGSVTLIPIAGDHWSLVRGDHVPQVAAELDAALERVGWAGGADRGSR